eukprot:gene7297-8113_t
MFLTYCILLLALAHGSESMCDKPCNVTILDAWPNNGYRAKAEVTAPKNYKQHVSFRVNLFFDTAPDLIENLYIRGGSINQGKSGLNGNRASLLYRPDQKIRKGSVVEIQFLIRYSGAMPKIVEVKFWKLGVCSSAPCPTGGGNGTTIVNPVSTSPSLFPKCDSKIVSQIDSGPDYFKVQLDLPVETAMDGWRLEILFTKPIQHLSNFPAQLVEERNKQYYVLQNFQHNRHLQPGVFSMIFMAHYDRNYETPKVAMLEFGSFVCKIDDAATTPPPTTPRPPTTAKATPPQTTKGKPKETTTKQPLTTSKPEVTTPVKTAKPEVTTPVKTAKPEVTTPAKTAKPEVTTNAVVTTSAPEVTTAPKTKKPSTPKQEITTSAPTTKRATTAKKPATTIASCQSEFDYNQVLNLSLLFYEAQRSGKLPASNRIPYRGDSALQDGSDVGKDLSGGYYDAGDMVKFGFPMAFTITALSWGAIEYKDAYVASGQYQYMLDAIKWGTDYFIKCHTAPNELYGQVGDGNADHGFWGRPEDMTMARPSAKIDQSKPGSDLAGETAAALAAASIVFKSDAAYSSELLLHAKQLFDFADKHRGVYSNSIPGAASFYRSWSGYNDELTWAAAWLYRASNEAKYLTAAKSFYSQFGMNGIPGEFSWDDKKAGVQVLMAQITSENTYKTHVQSFCDSILTKKRTPAGLVFIQKWGPNRHAANVAFICLMAADLGIKPTQYRAFARQQIYYMLGKPNSPRSFVVGFGKNPPKRPHHRSSSCPNKPEDCNWDEYNTAAPNPQILYGALVGGPGENDNYVDDRKDYIKNEVACDYNAGFQSALAGLKHLDLIGQC